MLIKVLIKRRIQDNNHKVADILLKTLRIEAMNQSGYISGETLFSQYDPTCIMVISIWQTTEDWYSWEENDKRKEIDAQLEKLLQEPAVYESFETVSTNLWKLV